MEKPRIKRASQAKGKSAERSKPAQKPKAAQSQPTKPVPKAKAGQKAKAGPATQASGSLKAGARSEQVPSKGTKPTPKGSAPTPGRAERGELSGVRVDKHGVAYLQGCTVPIWRLIMALRAGSRGAALIEAFPGLTDEGLAKATQYASRNPQKIASMIKRYGPGEVSQHVEVDDDDCFDRELDELLKRDAALYRRLAQ